MILTKSQIDSLLEVKKLIDSIPSKRIPITDLIALSRLPEDKLTKGFKKLFNQTIYQYQLRVSMTYAVSRLQKGELVKSVSIELGYRSPSSFTRAFVKIIKCQPIQVKNDGIPQ